MADGTKIEWTRGRDGRAGATWNILTGCNLKSPGCRKCYAMKLAGTRLRHTPSREGLTMATKTGPVWNGLWRFNKQWLNQPMEWKRPRRIFVCAHSDLFYEPVPDWVLDEIFAVMAVAHWHEFLVLTKRDERMKAYCNDPQTPGRVAMAIMAALGVTDERLAPAVARVAAWPLPNVWNGVSCEDQPHAAQRIWSLIRTKTAHRWISAEPLLGPIDLMMLVSADGKNVLDAVQGLIGHDIGTPEEPEWDGAEPCPRLEWVVSGGESGGKDSRPMHPDWEHDLHQQCDHAGVAYFRKQWGDWADYQHIGADEWNFVEERKGARYGYLAKDGTGMFGGRLFETRYLVGKHGQTGPCMVRVGKKLAGSKLFGRHEHQELPT